MLVASLPLIFFVFAGLFSPGPNVVMLTTSGARFGFRRTVPHLLGVPVGTGLLAAASAFGLGAVFTVLPSLKLAFQIAAAVWILWLAWKTAQAGRATARAEGDAPFTFLQAVTFQAINPKVWAVALAAAAGFSLELPIAAEALRLFLVFAVINLGVCLFWAAVGHTLARFLSSPVVWRWFMLMMAALMACSALLIFL